MQWIRIGPCSAARALRRAKDTETLTLTLETSEGVILAYTDPDRMRPSFMTGREREEPADMHLMDLGDGYLTNVAVEATSSAALVMSRWGDVLHFTLSYRPDHLTTDQAILIMRDFTERLAEPLLALV